MLIRCCVFLRYSRIIWHSHTLQREKQEVNKNNRQISQIYISTVITYNQRNSIETSLGLLLQVYTKIFVLNAKKKNETVNIGNFLSIKSFFTTINFHTFLFQNIQWYFIICVLSCQQKRKKIHKSTFRTLNIIWTQAFAQQGEITDIMHDQATSYLN